MEVRYPLEDGRGWLTVTEDGMRASCEAVLHDDGRGLYKAYLEGQGGRMPLGTLLPEGGTLYLRRTITLDEFRRRGAWPLIGGGVELAFATGGGQHKSAADWVREAYPQRRMGDPLLVRAAERAGTCLLRRETEGMALAFPWRVETPFPMVPLVCFAHPKQLNGTWYAVFYFNGRGCPVFPHKEQLDREE